MQKLVSVIIPTYKRECVARAIDSVLKQSYEKFEVIVVDDNDSESMHRISLEIAMRKYKNNHKVKYLQHEKNKNGSAARNTGIRKAKGDYIAFLDDDDYFSPNRLEILVSNLEKNSDYDAAYSSAAFVRNRRIIDIGRAEMSGSYERELLLEKFQIFTGSNLFFTRKSILNLGGFDESFLRHQDYEVLIRFFKKYKILAVDKILVVKNSDDRSNIPTSEKLYEIKQKYFQTFRNSIDLMSEEEKKFFYKNNYLNLLKNSIANKNKQIYKIVKKKLPILSFKEKMVVFLEKVNVLWNITGFKYIYKDFKLRKRLPQDILKLIDEVDI